MKALIFSDSHGNEDGMLRALRMHRDAEVCFFLGDGLSDLAGIRPLFPQVMFLSVAGNCDWFSANEPKTGVFTLEGHRVFYTHGHLFGVKGGFGALCADARRAGAEIALCGHTHVPLETCFGADETPRYLFNPGSIGMETDGFRHFGILDVRGDNVLLSHGRIL